MVTCVARKLRVQYPGALYHVMNRGDRREPIFRDDADRQSFLATLGEVCVKTGWQVHAYCLMPNHFHLVVETPQANLVAGMVNGSVPAIRQLPLDTWHHTIHPHSPERLRPRDRGEIHLQP